MKTQCLLVSLVLMLTNMAGGCHRSEHVHETRPTPVRVQVVGLTALKNGVRYSATIAPSEQVDLGFKVSGYVREILQVSDATGHRRTVEQGDFITKGTVLARVRESDYVERVNQVQSQLVRAEVSAQKAQLDWERARHLFSTQSVTKPDYDSAKAQRDSAQASVVGTRAQLQDVQLTLQDCALVAPMDGVVLQRRIEVGSLAAPGMVGFVLANLSFVKVIFGVPDTMLPQLQVGATLTIVTESHREEQFSGRITAIAPAADTRSRVFNIEVAVPNPKYLLKAGMIASLEVSREALAPPLPTIPLAAIIRAQDDPEGYAVFVVEEQAGVTVARLRRVQLGDIHGDTIVATTGVTPGEQVIVTGATLVSAGEAVRVVP